jgi:hypothetical protein
MAFQESQVRRLLCSNGARSVIDVKVVLLADCNKCRSLQKFTGASVSEARHRLYVAGWRSVDAQDLCPSCRKAPGQ